MGSQVVYILSECTNFCFGIDNIHILSISATRGGGYAQEAAIGIGTVGGGPLYHS